MIQREASIGGIFLVGAFLLFGIFIAVQCLKVIQNIPLNYYQLLPVSNSSDLDRDGIPDYIDDSDGDRIADANDPTPFGNSSLPLYKNKIMPNRSLKNKSFHGAL